MGPFPHLQEHLLGRHRRSFAPPSWGRGLGWCHRGCKAVPPISILQQIAPPLKNSWDSEKSSPSTRYLLGIVRTRGSLSVTMATFVGKFRCEFLQLSLHHVTHKVRVKVIIHAAEQRRVRRSLWSYKITGISCWGRGGEPVEID